MNAAELAQVLGGRKSGNRWMARCPAHADRTPSLSIRESLGGKLLVHCFAGCDRLQVIDALRSRGLWPSCSRGLDRRPSGYCRDRRLHGDRDRRDADDAVRTSRALSIWHQARPGARTIAETYLQGRGISLDVWPETLRFHAGLDHPSGGILPAMVGVVTKDNVPVGIHRTFLAPDGTDKAPVDPQKMMLGPSGGGAVRLGTVQPDNWLVVGEGIETTLSVIQPCGLPGWAALSDVGIKNLILPPEAQMVLICADNDVSGAGQRAAHAAAERFLREGRRVRIPAPRELGTDFNDLLNSVASTQVDQDMRHVG